MSSVDGAQSLQNTSDEIFEHVCDPCHYHGTTKEATGFCKDCQEKLCRNCTDSHKGLKLSRNHKIMSLSEVPVCEIPGQTDAGGVLCECGYNLANALYCQDHDDVFCGACGYLKHITCKIISVRKKIASYSIATFSTLDQKTNELINEIDEILNERRSNPESFKSMKEKAKTDIMNFRKEVSRQFDIMEQNILEELDERDSKNQLEVNRHISSCTTTKQKLQTDLKSINDAAKTGSKIAMFSLGVKISNRLTEYERLLHDVRQETKSGNLTFKRNVQLVDMLEKINTIGSLTEKTVYHDPPKWKLFSRLKVENKSQVHIKLRDDINSPCILGCAVLPDGQVVLCDNKNNKLKLLSKAFTLKGSLTLTGSPWDISVVNDSTVIVTLPNMCKLQYIAVLPRLKHGRVLRIGGACYGVEVVDGDIYVTCRTEKAKVKILDKDGNVKRRLEVGQDGKSMFYQPTYLTVNIKSNRIYVSDYGQHELTCLKSDGTVVYRYKNPHLCGPHGVCVDDNDNILFCSKDSKNVHIVTADGHKREILLTAKDGLVSPQSLAYRHIDDTMVIGCWGCDKLSVFRLTPC